jgi:hypothetical protein
MFDQSKKTISKPVLRTLVVAVGISLIAGGANAGGPVCGESCLLGIAGDYLDALSANDPTAAHLSPAVKATENGVAMRPGDGVWQSATGWTYRHTFVDPGTGGIGVFGIVSEGPDKSAAVTIRLKVTNDLVTESELLVTRPGEFALFNPAITDARAVFSDYVPAGQQSSRDQLKAIARSYFTGITKADPSKVPFSPDCNRVENGVQTTNSGPRLSASCAEGLKHFAYMQSFRQLRFPVVDVQRGLVWGVLAFDLPAMTKTVTIRGKPYEITPERQHLPRTLFLYELFKIEGGRIRAIEAWMRNMPIGSDMGWPGERG